MLRCQKRSDQRKAHWKTCKKEVKKATNTQADTNAIIRGAWQWLNHQIPEENSEAEIEQAKVSWEQVFLGRLAIGWRYEIGKSKLTNMLPIASSLLNFSRNMWTSRNHQLHGEGNDEKMLKKSKKLQAKVRDAYKQKKEIDDIDKSVFKDKMKITLQQTNKRIASWLSTFNKAKSASQKRLKWTNRTRDIRAFLR